MTAYCSTFLSSFGSFSVAVNARGAVVGTAFGDTEALRKRLSCEALISDESRTRAAVSQIRDFLAGKRQDFDLPVTPAGSEFQQKVWTSLRRIPFGQTRSYGEIARQLDSSARAVGRANATNPVCLIIPCHRVIGADGSLTGFAFGGELKRRLLALEGLQLPLD